MPRSLIYLDFAKILASEIFRFYHKIKVAEHLVSLAFQFTRHSPISGFSASPRTRKLKMMSSPYEDTDLFVCGAIIDYAFIRTIALVQL